MITSSDSNNWVSCVMMLQSDFPEIEIEVLNTC